MEKGQQALEAFRGSGNKDATADAVRLVDSSGLLSCLSAKLVKLVGAGAFFSETFM